MKKIILLILVLFVTGCTFFETSVSDKNLFLDLIDSIEKEGYLNSYTIYGKYFNISGELQEEVENLILVLKSVDEEIEYELITKVSNNKTIFKTNNLINEGIDLEEILTGEYVFLLKNVDETKYYSLKNKTNYDDLEYYTITKNKENKKIDIAFDSYQDKSFLYLEAISTKLPEEIYDIVIDPGHGGVDVGANKNGYYESHINLDYALELKEELTKVGLKVKLTRETDESISTYGENGRVSIPYQTKAKLLLSIHMNSAIKNVGNGGVEIYVPNHANTLFASNLAKNIVDLTSTNYSKNVSNKISSGVYLRTFTKDDIESIKEEALEGDYAPYEKATTDSTYYYIIRETGGIITNAYVDSRNKEKDYNHYYSSNHGCESYLLELGFMNSATNLNILLTEREKYVEAIVKSVKEYLEI